MPATDSAGSDSTDRELVIKRIFDAPRDLVFKCWTDPEHATRWMGPKGFTGDIISYDLRPGGNYRFYMRGPDGEDHWQQGVFREIVPPERLVRTFCWADGNGNPTRPETVLTLTFADLGGKTELTLHQAQFESVTARDMHRGGWSSSLDRLAEVLARI